MEARVSVSRRWWSKCGHGQKWHWFCFPLLLRIIPFQKLPKMHSLFRWSPLCRGRRPATSSQVLRTTSVVRERAEEKLMSLISIIGHTSPAICGSFCKSKSHTHDTSTHTHTGHPFALLGISTAASFCKYEFMHVNRIVFQNKNILDPGKSGAVVRMHAQHRPFLASLDSAYWSFINACQLMASPHIRSFLPSTIPTHVALQCST